MNDISERIARMSPERRKVLEKLLQKEGTELPASRTGDSPGTGSASFKEPSSDEKEKAGQLYDSLVREQSETLLVRIQPHGEKVPLFLIHPIGGSVFCYTELARLRTERPIYGIKASGLAPGTSPLTHIEDMVGQYIRRMRDVHPGGPYLLGGVSAGGNIAYEMARQLRQKGEDVHLLILIDTFSFYDYIVEDDVGYFLAFSLSFGLFFHADPVGAYYETLKISPDEGIDAIRREVQRLSSRERLELLKKCMSKAGVVGSDISVEHLNRYFSVYVANCRALLNYAPRPYPGKIVLFRATTDDPLALKLGDPDRRQTDKTLGWNRYASDIEVHDIPGSNHYTILTPPHVSMVAEKLRDELKR